MSVFPIMPTNSVFIFLWQIRGQEVEDFIVAAQDRSKNAHSKSMMAAYNAWTESLRSDQAQFESQRILSLGCTFSKLLNHDIKSINVVRPLF